MKSKSALIYAILLVFFFAGTLFAQEDDTSAPSLLDAQLALTPPMGWNSWNKFHCNVSEQLIARHGGCDGEIRHERRRLSVRHH